MEKKKTWVFKAEESLVGKRLDVALLELSSEITSRNRAHFLIQNQFVTVNERSCKPSQKLKESDTIEVVIPEQPLEPTQVEPENIPLDIQYEDSHLLVVNKPPHLVVHPSVGHPNGTLVNALLYHCKDLKLNFSEPRPGIVHRIDKETSGLLVVAKNDESLKQLSQQFKDKTTKRRYEALTHGHVSEKLIKIQSYIDRHPIHRKKMASIRNNREIIDTFDEDHQKGKWAVTHIIQKQHLNNPFSFVELELETGRTHQIRVHLSEKGHPIVGDETYGGQSRDRALSRTNKTMGRILEPLDRFLLHAKTLGFKHPQTKEDLHFTVPWPDNSLTILKSLGVKMLEGS